MSVPLYQSIKDHVLRHIEDGTWVAGDKISSENTLAKQFGVSRMTANRAFKELQDEGILLRVSGAGSFVAPPRAQNEFLAIRDISEELAAQNHTHEMQVLQRRTIKATKKLAHRFELPRGAKLFYVEILHSGNGLPILLERRWVNAALLPDFENVDLNQTSTYQYLMTKAPLQRAEHRVRALNADADIQTALQLDAHAACLILHRRTWSSDKIVSCADLVYGGERYEFTGIFTP